MALRACSFSLFKEIDLNQTSKNLYVTFCGKKIFSTEQSYLDSRKLKLADFGIILLHFVRFAMRFQIAINLNLSEAGSSVPFIWPRRF